MLNTAFLLFRLRQVGKFLRDIPIPYLIILLAIIAIVVYIMSLFIKDINGALICGGGVLALVSLIHLGRKDYHFIQLTDEHHWRVFSVDYLLITLPVWVLELVQGFWFVSLIIIAGCVGISFLKQPFYRTVKGFPVPRMIPSEAFEVRAFIRRYGGLLLVLYASAFIGLVFPYASFISLWFLTVFLLGSYQNCESRAILNCRGMPAERFLRYKIGINLRLFFIVIAPVCLIYTILRPGDWWLALGFFVLASLNMVVFIVAKYAVYEPDKKNINGQISLGLSVLGILVPIFAPLTLLLLIRYYIMARKNLTPYLYAYD